MTNVSPLRSPILANTIQQNKQNENHHEKVYQQLTKRANDVKPNESKAKLVRQNPLQAAASSVSDVFKDGKNFFTAVKTGKLSDNSLGRINDLGLKAGAGLIAAYLAFHAKTKTSSIMSFLGGATFLSMMPLWPKFFINLPARLVHGFKIDQKYINAQGEKKDFFLDNQFLPWDVFSDNELREYAKRSGIDYDSENGKEKIMRKMQKTALQNRTLWMATAGFATPLMTAVIGDAVEPHVKNAVIDHGFKKSVKEMNNLDETLGYAPKIVKNQKELNDLFTQYKDNLDDEGLKKIASQLNMNFSDVFKDPDDLKPIQGVTLNISSEQLKNVRKQTSLIEENAQDFEQKLKESFSKLAAQTKDDFDNIFGVDSDVIDASKDLKAKLSNDAFDEVVKEFKALPAENKTIKNLAQMFASKAGDDKETATQIQELISNAQLKLNDAPFFETIKDYNENIISSIRGKLKVYAKTLNRVAGSKDESVFTRIYRNTMAKLFKQADFSKQELGKLKNSALDTGNSDSIEILSKFYQRFVGMDDKEYKEELTVLFDDMRQEYINVLKNSNGNDKTLLNKMIDAFVYKDNIDKISRLDGNAKNEIYAELNSGLADSIKSNINHFMDVAKTNIQSINARNLITAGFERYIASQDFEKDLIDKGLVLSEEAKELMDKKGYKYLDLRPQEWAKIARELVYEGSVAMDASRVELPADAYADLKSVIYDAKHYGTEIGLMRELTLMLHSKERQKDLEKYLETKKISISELTIDKIKEYFKTLDEFKNLEDKKIDEKVMSEIKNGFLQNLISSGTSPKDNAAITGISGLVRSYAKEVLNNKNWKSIFVPMTIALVAVTLLAQPFFGNISKEYPKNKKKEAE